MIALSVAALLAVFLLYTSFTGTGMPAVAPSELGSRADRVQLAGVVEGPIRVDGETASRMFRLADFDGTAAVAVLYRGSVPDQFRVGRQVYLEGRLADGVFVAKPGSLVTKCPSKFTATKRSGPRSRHQAEHQR